MSRIGKQPIQIPAGVEVKIEKNNITVKGPKGELKQTIHPWVLIEQKNDSIVVSPIKDNKIANALWGTFRQIIANLITGVTKGFEKKLEVNGVGYKVALSGNNLTLNVGFSHPVDFKIPQGINVSVIKNVITVQGIDKQLVGETAAQIRNIRPPEPYKGKGIKYVDEVIRRKAGKAAKAAS